MLSYDKYIEYGGNVEEVDFPLFLTQANLKLNFLTNVDWNEYDYDGDLKCELLVTKVINLLDEKTKQNLKGISSYSNGIESITYDGSFTEKGVTKQIHNLCKEYLVGTGLLYRGV